MRKLVLAGALLVGAIALPAVATSPVRPLSLDTAQFWDGGFVVDGSTPFEYPLDVQAGGARLRVAIDTPSREDSFVLDVVDPSGAVKATAENSNQFNAEAFVAEPAGGRWLVRVTPNGATRASFRLRAKLERAVAGPPAGRVAMLPNLRTVPPYELTFIAPANPLNGLYPPDTVNPPLDAAGVHPVSCTVDEAAPVEAGGAGARRCLRLTSGPINIGTGPFDMRFSMTEDVTDGDLDPAYLRGPIDQMVHYSDGSSALRSAGTYIFHTTHAHFHDENILTYELFKVRGSTLVRAGAGVKSGFCPADQLFGEWERFVQQPAGFFGEGDSPTGSCFSPNDGFIGLTVGWGDVYRWQRPGQYVEFGTNTDGLYVIRSTVDKGNQVLESNDADNASYALVRITGEVITPIERGWGLSPFDPAKVVFSGSGPASRA
jgi:hypothetical protein